MAKRRVGYNGGVTLQILLTNDDGIEAPGIAALRRAVEGLGAVTTIAPDRNNSAVARGITIGRPLRLRHVTFGDGWRALTIDGTPSDCVRVGLLGLETPAPDLVVSGINHGANLGADVTYSGTVGAALEAALRGRPALAFSVEQREPGWLDEAVPVVRSLIRQAIEHGMQRRGILNINLPDRPAAEFAGVRPARLGGASCHDRVLLAGDPADSSGNGHDGWREHFLPCEETRQADWADTDVDLVARGFVAVTPIHYDLLDARMLADLSSWDLSLSDIGQARP